MNQILIPDATNGKTVSLTAVEPGYTAKVEIEVAVVGVDITALRRTPPVTAAAVVLLLHSTLDI
jgi:hypothetical protein